MSPKIAALGLVEPDQPFLKRDRSGRHLSHCYSLRSHRVAGSAAQCALR